MESFTEKRDGRSKQEKIPEISGHKKTFPATAGNVRIKKKNGALTGTRTQDPVIKSHLLYQLSYERICNRIPPATAYNIEPEAYFFKRLFSKVFNFS